MTPLLQHFDQWNDVWRLKDADDNALGMPALGLHDACVIPMNSKQWRIKRSGVIHISEQFHLEIRALGPFS